jgi:hypothetical protein
MSHAACLLAVTACLIPLGARAAIPLSLDKAQLGMTLAEWRSLAPPEGAGPDASPACSDDPRIATLDHNPLSASFQPSGEETCAYVDLFGHTALPHSIRLDAHYRADNLQYLFNRGRLFEIHFSAPIDAFSDVMTMLERQYGPPTATLRDEVRAPDGRFARVTETWRSARGEIRLVDPSMALTELDVSLVAPGDRAGRQSVASTAAALER